MVQSFYRCLKMKPLTIYLRVPLFKTWTNLSLIKNVTNYNNIKLKQHNLIRHADHIVYSLRQQLRCELFWMYYEKYYYLLHPKGIENVTTKICLILCISNSNPVGSCATTSHCVLS
jgi:hypothetical protein